MKAVFTERDIKIVAKMIKEDKFSIQEIAESYKCDHNTVRRFCNKNDIKYVGRITNKKDISKKKLLEVYTNPELTNIEKSKILGIGTSTLYKKLAYNNISVNSKRDAFYYVDRNNKEDLLDLLKDININASTKCSKLDVDLEKLISLYKENNLNYFEYNVPKPLSELEIACVNVDDEVVPVSIEQLNILKLDEIERNSKDKEEIHNKIDEIIEEESDYIEPCDCVNKKNDIEEIQSQNKSQNLQTLNINISLIFNFNSPSDLNGIGSEIGKMIEGGIRPLI